MNNIRNRTQPPEQRQRPIEGLPRERFSPSTLSSPEQARKAAVVFTRQADIGPIGRSPPLKKSESDRRFHAESRYRTSRAGTDRMLVCISAVLTAARWPFRRTPG